MNRAHDRLYALLEEIAALRKTAKAVGVFTNDRELLECSSCGLMEDVASGGLLITYRPNTPIRDTGLRFRQLRGDRFRCPECGSIVREIEGREAVKAKSAKRKA